MSGKSELKTLMDRGEVGLAKIFERDQIAADHTIELRAAEMPDPIGFDLPPMNRKERRSFGSDKQRLKGLRP